MRVAGKREAAEQPVDAGEEAGRLRRDAGDVGPIELVAQLPTDLVPGRRAGVIVEAATRNKAEGEKRGVDGRVADARGWARTVRAW